MALADLKIISGLPLKLDIEKSQLVFGEGIMPVKADIRTLEQMREVLFNPESQEPKELYYMYRGVFLPRDQEKAKKYNLRFDITILRPGKVGEEYIKTAGHYHPLKKGQKTTYPEVYEVLNGQAHYLFQRFGKDFDDIEDVILVKAKPGQKVIVPPNYGHITINAGSEPLVMSNWVAQDFSSTYEGIKKMGGGAYFIVEEAEKEFFAPNIRYSQIPPLKELKAKEMPSWGLVWDKPMYISCLNDPQRFRFLTHPEEFLEEFNQGLELL
jgi:glucose-6-phosphate isomerase